MIVHVCVIMIVRARMHVCVCACVIVRAYVIVRDRVLRVYRACVIVHVCIHACERICMHCYLGGRAGRRLRHLDRPACACVRVLACARVCVLFFVHTCT